MSVARNHAFGAAVNGKIYVIGGRTGHAFILSATNTDVVEEYNPVSNSWSAPKERMPTARSGGAWGTDGRRIYVAGGEVTTTELVGAFRAIEAYDTADEFVDHAAPDADAASRRRGRGDRQSLSPGERDDPVRRGADVPRPEARNPHGESRHPGAAVQSASSNGCAEERERRLPRMQRLWVRLLLPAPLVKNVSAVSSKGANSVGTASSGGKKPYTRYNVNSPEGQVMLAKYARAVEIMRTLPDYDQHSWKWWWYTHWVKGYPAALWDLSEKKKAEVIASLPDGISSRRRGGVERLPGARLQPLRP